MHAASTHHQQQQQSYSTSRLATTGASSAFQQQLQIGGSTSAVGGGGGIGGGMSMSSMPHQRRVVQQQFKPIAQQQQNGSHSKEYHQSAFRQYTRTSTSSTTTGAANGHGGSGGGSHSVSRVQTGGSQRYTSAQAKYDGDMDEYAVEAREWLRWVQRASQLMRDRQVPVNQAELRQLQLEINRFRQDELPGKLRDKQRLADKYTELLRLFSGTGQLSVDEDLSTANLDRAWSTLIKSLEERDRIISERSQALGTANDLTTRLRQGIGETNEKLDHILTRIETAERQITTAKPVEMKDILDKIVADLNRLETPIMSYFDDVENLERARHPESADYKLQVTGLQQRRGAYLQRVEGQLFPQINQRSETMRRVEVEKYERIRNEVFGSCQEAMDWVEMKLRELTEMQFSEELEVLDRIFEQHKLDHRDIMDFRQTVDQCIARQAETSAEDSQVYYDMLSTLESDYQQLRDLASGRMLDLDTLIAFLRAAQVELMWINEREELEVTRNWSDVKQLDIPMLQNYYKQLLHEIELREEQFNAVHNKGAAFLNQGHPAVQVIEVYLSTMQSQWEWLLSLAKCLEVHLQDAMNLKALNEEAETIAEIMNKQMQLLETDYDRRDITLEDGDKLLQKLQDINNSLNQSEEILASLFERSRNISPLWQRGECIDSQMNVTALCDYQDRYPNMFPDIDPMSNHTTCNDILLQIQIRRGDECRLLNNADLIKWAVRGADGVEAQVASVVFRLPPPDSRLVAFLNRLRSQFERLRRIYQEKWLSIRSSILINTMRTVQGWDLEAFLRLDPDQRDAIMEALRDDVNKLISELPPNDPMAARLREELQITMDHFYKLLQMSQKEPEPDYSKLYDEKIGLFLGSLEEYWVRLNQRVSNPVPRNVDDLQNLLTEHKQFEDSLQALDSEMTALHELFRQIQDPTPMQRTKMDQLNARWSDLWELSMMYVKRLTSVEEVLSGADEAADLIKRHEIFLGSVDTMSADLDTLRAMHSQIIEVNMRLHEQQPLMDDLAKSIGQLRQHVAATRYNVADHPDVDRLEDEIQKLTVRWENVCSQVLERFKSSELALQILMVYRSDYENEIQWLDRVEATINSLRDPQSLPPEQYQAQLDILMSEYAQLQERTETIENVNHEGGKFIREGKSHDGRLDQYESTLLGVHGPQLRVLLQKTQPPPEAGHVVVRRELDELNRRFSHLSSIILERRNVIQVLIQNWKRRQQEESDRQKADDEARRRAADDAARRAAEEAERLRRQKEEEDARRRAADQEAERLRRQREDEEARRRAEEARRRQMDDADRDAARRAAEEEARRRAEEEARRRAEEEARRRAAEDEARRRAEEEARRRAQLEEQRRQKESLQQSCSAAEVDIDSLLIRLLSIEKSLAALRPGQTSETVQKTMANFKSKRMDLNALQPEINSCLQTTDDLCSEGADILSPEEFHNLRSHRDQLRENTSLITAEAAYLSERLDVTLTKCTKFEAEVLAFTKWLSSTRQRIEKITKVTDPEKMKTALADAQAVNEDIIAHAAALKNIQLTKNEINAELDDFSRAQSAKGKYLIEPTEDQLRQTVMDLTEQYDNLEMLTQHMNNMHDKLKDQWQLYDKEYQHSEQWLSSMFGAISDLKKREKDASTEELNDKLSAVRDLRQKLMSEERCVARTCDLAQSYAQSVQQYNPDDEHAKNVLGNAEQLQYRLKQAHDSLGSEMEATQALFTQTQDLQQQIKEAQGWLQRASSVLDAKKPIPLDSAKLQSQVDEQKLLHSELNERLAALSNLKQSAEKLQGNSVSQQQTTAALKKLETGLKESSTKCRAWGDNLTDASKKLQKFNDLQKDLCAWVQKTTAEVNAASNSPKSLEVLAEANKQVELREPDLAAVKSCARYLLNMPHVTDEQKVIEPMDTADKHWITLLSLLDTCKQTQLEREQSGSEYKTQHDVVVKWLSNFESRMDALPPVAVSSALCAKQRSGLSPMRTEYDDFKEKLQTLNKLAEQVLRSHRKSATPEPKTSDSMTQSMNTSGFYSFDNLGDYASEDLSTVQRQLIDANHRYEHLGKRLTDREDELQSTMLTLNEYEAERDVLIKFLESCVQSLNSVDKTPSELSAVKTSTEKVNDIMVNMSKQKANLDANKSRAHQISRLKDVNSVPGLSELHETEAQIDRDWSDTHAACTQAVQSLQQLIQYHSLVKQLTKWLAAKTKIINLLQPITTDVKALNAQLQQLDVLKDERDENESELEQLDEVTFELVKAHGRAAEEFQQSTSALHEQWEQLGVMIEHRQTALQAAIELSDRYLSLNSMVVQWLKETNGKLDDLAGKPPGSSKAAQADYQAQLLKINHEVEAESSTVTELGEAAKQLAEATTDSAVQSNLMSAVQSIQQSYEEIKLRIKSMSEALTLMHDQSQQFGKQFDELLTWVGDARRELQDQEPVSADSAKLQQQRSAFEPFYDSVLGHEGQVTLCRAKAVELQNEGDTNKTIAESIDQLDAQWYPLLTATKARQQQLKDACDSASQWQNTSKKVKSTLLNALAASDKLQKESLSPNKKQADEVTETATKLQHKFDVDQHQYDSALEVADKLKETTEKDHETLQNEVLDLNETYKKTKDTIAEVHADAKEQQNLWGDYETSVYQVKTALDRCDEQLKAVDMRSSKSSGKLRSLLDDIEGPIKQGINRAHASCENLMSFVAERTDDPSIKAPIEQQCTAEIEGLRSRSTTIDTELKEKIEVLDQTEKGVQQLRERVSSLGRDVKGVEVEFGELSPVARHPDELTSQEAEMVLMAEKVDAIKEDLEQATTDSQKLKENETAGHEAQSALGQLSLLSQDVDNLHAKCSKRLDGIKDTKNALETIAEQLVDVQNQVHEVLGDEALQQPIQATSSGIQDQQKQLVDLRTRTDSLGTCVNDLNAETRKLCKTAATTVDTTWLETEAGQMNDSWKELQDRMDERNTQLQASLSGIGSYQDTVRDLLTWLEDAEETVSNQRSPSYDPKVIRVQLQGHEVLRKMVEDKQPSVNAFDTMNEQLQSVAPESQEYAVDKDNINQRYDQLGDEVRLRLEQLHHALNLSEQWNAQLAATRNWLKDKEHCLREFSNVPTDPERIAELIELQKHMATEVKEYRPFIDGLVELEQNLADVTSDSEVEQLEQQLVDVENRYNELGRRSETVGELLLQMAEGLADLTERTQELTQVLDNLSDDLSSYDQLAVFRDELEDQIGNVTDIVDKVLDKQEDVYSIVQEFKECRKHINDEDVIDLTQKIEVMKDKFESLHRNADFKIMMMQKALQPTEVFSSLYEKINDWLVDLESDLEQFDKATIDEQQDILRNMQHDIDDFRPELDLMNQAAGELSQLSPDNSDALKEKTRALNQRFDAACDLVNRKAERLEMSIAQSTDIESDLDELIDWLSRARDRMESAGSASATASVVQDQLRDQTIMNGDIVSQKTRVRDRTAATRKHIRNFSHHGGEELQNMQQKLEHLNNLCDVVSQLSVDRLAVLEQALPLAIDFKATYDECDRWLSDLEDELSNCPTISYGLHPEQLSRQKSHNKELVERIALLKPVLDKFDKTCMALSVLVNEEDSIRVNETATEVLQRFANLREQVRSRDEALDEALSQSSQFTDKLDQMLAAFTDASDSLRNAEPVASQPNKLRNQIEDNSMLIEHMEQKAQAQLAVIKDAANDIIRKADPNDPAVYEIGEKVQRLDELWADIMLGTEQRGRTLAETLLVAERFWDEYDSCMQSLSLLKDKLDAETAPACEPDALKLQQETLENIDREISMARPALQQCQVSGEQLLALVDPTEQPEIEVSMNNLVGAYDTVTDMCSRRHTNLIEAMEKAMTFHETLGSLLDWIQSAEQSLEEAVPVTTMSLEQIQPELVKVAEFNQQLESKAVEKEQLSQACYELSETTSPAQAVAVKQPMQDINRRWQYVTSGMNDRQQKLERALLELGHFQQAYDQLMGWVAKATNTVSEISAVPGDLRQNEIELAKHKVLTNDVSAHEPSVRTLNDAADRMPSDQKAATEHKMQALNEQWYDLQTLLKDKQEELTKAKEAAESFGGDIDKWNHWLEDMDAVISSTRPTAGLPETARQQLEHFTEVEQEIEESREQLDKMFADCERLLMINDDKAHSYVAQRVKAMRNKWSNLLVKKSDRKTKLEIALRDAEDLHNLIVKFNEWLSEREQELNRMLPVSRLIQPLEAQMEEHNALKSDVSAHRDNDLKEVQNRGTQMHYYCEKKDAIPIKNLLVSAKNRFEKVASRTAERTRQLETGHQETVEFNQAFEQLDQWVESTRLLLLKQEQQPPSNPERIREQLTSHKELQQEIGRHQKDFDEVNKLGRALRDHAPVSEQPEIEERLASIHAAWTKLCSHSVQRQQTLENGLLMSGQFEEAVKNLLDWLDRTAPSLALDTNVHGDLDTVNSLVQQHKLLQQALKSKEASLETVRKAAEELSSKSDQAGKANIDANMTKLNEDWKQVNDSSQLHAEKLSVALKDAQEFSQKSNAMLKWLEETETSLRAVGAAAHDEQSLNGQTEKIEKLLGDIAEQHGRLTECLDAGREIQSKCHPKAEQPMKHWLAVLESRWREVTDWANEKQQVVNNELYATRQRNALLDELVSWVNTKDDELQFAEEMPLPNETADIEKLIVEHGQFEEELRSRQPEIDEATKTVRTGDTAEPSTSSAQLSAVSKTAAKSKSSEALTAQKAKAAAEARAPAGKAGQLQTKWRSLWMASLQRKRRLDDHLDHVKEVARLESFSWDEWRARYMGWINNKKSRALDYFRRHDKDGLGQMPREQFIDVIIQSKFPTSRLEMHKVADLFDKANDGWIDYRDFVNALRPDRQINNKPDTDEEKIEDEMKRQVRMCKCHDRYAISAAGPNKYRFGENQKIRLVRILRSTVMVRVGGGWEALDEFLVKHDPCRAKGRTNLELREKFILADGVSQNMAAFRSKPLSESPSTSSTPPRQGPITKIREKTERSTPMNVRRPSATPSSAKTSLSDLSASATPGPESRLPVPSGASSRGSSRPPSRPSSRASESSEVSSASAFGTRIPSIRRSSKPK